MPSVELVKKEITLANLVKNLLDIYSEKGDIGLMQKNIDDKGCSLAFNLFFLADEIKFIMDESSIEIRKGLKECLFLFLKENGVIFSTVGLNRYIDSETKKEEYAFVIKK